MAVLLLISHIHWDLVMPILPFNSPELSLSCMFHDLASFYGKTGVSKSLYYFLTLLKTCCCITPYDDVIKVLQVVWSSTFFWCSMAQSVANGGTVFPLLRRVHAGVLGTSPGESKLWPARWCYRDREKGVGSTSYRVPLGCRWFRFVLEFCCVWHSSAYGW